MREVVFRGKPKDETQYYFFSQIWKDNCVDGFACGSLVVDKGRCFIAVSALCSIKSCINNGMISMIEVIPETVGQFTGLYDNTKWKELTTEEQALFLYPELGGKRSKEEWNGKKIFEGDIVMLNVKGHNTVCTVSWAENVAQFQLWQINTIPNTSTALNLGNYDCKIIGNIHDNPEILNKEAKK